MVVPGKACHSATLSTANHLGTVNSRVNLRGGADKSLARPGRKQADGT
jgi:hypothetical protein